MENCCLHAVYDTELEAATGLVRFRIHQFIHKLGFQKINDDKAKIAVLNLIGNLNNKYFEDRLLKFVY